jgi:TolA-binding protein
MSQPHDELETVSASLGELVRSTAASAHARNGASARARLLDRALSESDRPRAFGTRWLAMALPAMAAALVVWWVLPRSLTYEVVGAKKDGAYVSAPSDHEITVRFSDATQLEVAAGSQLRVEDTNRLGARVLLERGSADVHVVHKEGTRWTFAAGPFDVAVTGTRFVLQWDASAEVLDLRLTEGSVEIQTPFASAPVALRAGQAFHADLHRRTMTTTDGDDHARADAPPEAAAAPSAVATDENPVPSPPPANAPSAGTPEPHAKTRPWSSLVAAGQFATVLAQADERGIDGCLRSCAASDLSALADAARYTGRADVAQRALQALVSRFGRETEGRNAEFLLGRLLEQQGDLAQARTWYQRYRSHVADGAYAAEALAGTMRVTQKLEGRAAAQPIARDYLQRYPAGADAATARSILGQL